MASSAPSMPFIKNLASSDRKIRTHALDSLKAFLTAKYAGSATSATAPLTFHDAQKLWAGLFYALWMADRAQAQQRLCEELAGLPKAVKLPDAAVAAWLRAFWATMARQWTTGIDVLRMDKFLLLVRRVLGAQLAWMAGEEEGDGGKAVAAEAEALGLDILAQWPFNVDAVAVIEASPDSENSSGEDGDANGRPRKRSRKVVPTVHIPVGLTLHAVDIWVDEAEKVGLLKTTGAKKDETSDEETDGANEEETLAHRINALVVALVAKTTAPAVRKRASEALADERLPWNESQAAAEEGGGGIEAQADSDEVEEGNGDGSWDGFND